MHHSLSRQVGKHCFGVVVVGWDWAAGTVCALGVCVFSMVRQLVQTRRFGALQRLLTARHELKLQTTWMLPMWHGLRTTWSASHTSHASQSHTTGGHTRVWGGGYVCHTVCVCVCVGGGDLEGLHQVPQLLALQMGHIIITGQPLRLPTTWMLLTWPGVLGTAMTARSVCGG